jgi:hypothetical protein
MKRKKTEKTTHKAKFLIVIKSCYLCFYTSEKRLVYKEALREQAR